MRFYRLEITNAPAGEQDITYTSLVNGQDDPGALDIEIDIPSAYFASPVGGANIKVYGVSIQTIAQGTDLNPSSDGATPGATVKLYAGMTKGLPLANPSQQGLILQGSVFQAFGNWVDTNMWLELNVMPLAQGISNDNPANLSFIWKKGSALKDNVTQALTIAYPGYTITNTIDPSLVLTQDEIGCYNTIGQFSAFVMNLSQSLNQAPTYGGAQVALQGTSFIAQDGSQPATNVKNIAFTDLIGQPTWIGPSQIQFSCVMRADINVGDSVKMPQAVTTSTQAEQSAQAADKSQFQGTFSIALVRHVGKLRQPNAESWITTFNANALGATSATAGS